VKSLFVGLGLMVLAVGPLVGLGVYLVTHPAELRQLMGPPDVHMCRCP
jgi:hypothetical protein